MFGCQDGDGEVGEERHGGVLDLDLDLNLSFWRVLGGLVGLRAWREKVEG